MPINTKTKITLDMEKQNSKTPVIGGMSAINPDKG
jgi:hypothetical protein